MRVLGAALCLLFGVLFLVMYNDHPTWMWGWRAALLILAAMMALLALILIYQTWLTDIQPLRDDHARRKAEIAAMTPQSVLVDKIRQLRPDQITYFMRSGVTLINEPGLTGPNEIYRFPVTKPLDRAGLWEIPKDFVETYMTRATDQGLDAKRNYPEGKQRDYVQHIVDFYVERRLANEASGPYSARWTVSREQAYQWLGWEWKMEEE